MKILNKLFLVLFILCFSITSSFGIDEEKDNSKPLSLKDCIELALKNSPYVRKQKLNYEVAKRDVKIAQSVYFPTVGASVESSRRINRKR